MHLEMALYPIDSLNAAAIFAVLTGFAALGYIIYQRYFHPLAEFPGPFLASVTDLWQVQQFLSLKQPYHLTELHEKYGPFVRYGPDKLSVITEDAIPLIYQKSGRMMPKTEFYDAYGAAHPNVFGMRDENVNFIYKQSLLYACLTLTDESSIQFEDVTCRIASLSRM